jgi:uncharacterized protein (TIGR02300 family)
LSPGARIVPESLTTGLEIARAVVKWGSGPGPEKGFRACLNRALYSRLRSWQAPDPTYGEETLATDLGEKHTCPECGAKFYDLGKHPVVCPKCKTVITTADDSAKPKRSREKPKAAPVKAKSKAVDEDEDEDDDDEDEDDEDEDEDEDDEDLDDDETDEVDMEDDETIETDEEDTDTPVPAATKRKGTTARDFTGSDEDEDEEVEGDDDEDDGLTIVDEDDEDFDDEDIDLEDDEEES